MTQQADIPSALPPGYHRSAPRGPWIATWLVALVLAVFGVGLLERHVRELGFRPSVKDDPHLWAIERSKAGGHDRVVVIGNSRAQLGVSTETLRRELPDRRVVQLAIENTSAIDVLADLAADPDFTGIVLVDALEGNLASSHRAVRPYLAAYHHRWRAPGAIASRWLAVRVESWLALRSAGGRRALLSWLAKGTWAPALYVATAPDRSRQADYSMMTARDLERRMKRRRSRKPAEPRRWIERVARIEPMVRAIHARGGQVVFVRLPVTGSLREDNERTYPRPEFWDRFAAQTGAITIHSLDYPELSDFDLVDESHLDMRDAPRFTRTLVAVLARRGVWQRRARP